jgi:molybdopterin-binding protein
MPQFRIGQAAELLGVSVDTMRRWADSGRVRTARAGSGQRLIDGADLARFAIELSESAEHEAGFQSARNRLPGIVTRVEKDTIMAKVELQAGAHRIVSLMTREAADELGLEPGVMATAVVKSTNVVIETST